ncbi:MAG: enoyl-CoA hydratase/isomerase family protein [Rhizomicrobium sp.]
MPEPSAPILFEVRGHLGLVTLNRPDALNALTRPMCALMRKMLEQWSGDDEIVAVAIRGLGPRAFCAGGDIRAMAKSSEQKTDEAAQFLKDEYRLNAAIGAFGKPFVALTHGVVMGGGAGVSVHGGFRAASGDLLFAMPETGIGFVPDIGSSYFLSRCPGKAGIYLALTGAGIGLGEALEWGLMTHAISAGDHDVLISGLAEGVAVEKLLAAHRQPRPAPRIALDRERMNVAFSAPSVEAVLERLDRDGSPFSAQTARTLRGRSPFSLKLAFRLIKEGGKRTREDCLKMEYRVASRRVMDADFREGVRAQLTDKDNQPRWVPAALAEVKDGDIAGYFAPLGAGELAI